MGLLARYRRLWFVLIAATLATPLTVQLVTPRQDVSQREARPLKAPPAIPHSFAQWMTLPRAVDAFLGDHFGLRDMLVRTNAVMRHALVSPTNSGVFYGRDGRLFFNGDAMLEQSLGIAQRNTEIGRFADFAAGLAKDYRTRGIRFLVAIPPNATTIERQFTPSWFTSSSPTEYDTMLRALARRGVPYVDLRLPLAAINESTPVYLETDTHWNRLGALLAYNEVAAALERPEWIIPPNNVFTGFEPKAGGDLARMLGAPADIHDRDARIDLSSYKPVPLKTTLLNTRKVETGGNVTETGLVGESVVVIGDSFTEHAWRDYFALHVSRFAWIHHELCDFFPDVVEAQKPDVVILAPTERFMFCWNRKD